ncbi:ABC-2 transporter permease [Bacillus sp. MHSD_36]|uniref:ABC-2 transporter permease n=1 Tax=unclassified Bacillus (in: firmicutes) TaxID=185979 RepID=UPI00274184F2|nr:MULTISPECIES: ABC-2 transporter permease [unclassified Bacillus (in: firmicutes)]MDP7990151.1 ABC-2 transporter permease [Bacillus sp. MHSD_36]MDR4979075.1 ABC-2 transporter permease [Bacillus sp. MHSD_37]
MRQLIYKDLFFFRVMWLVNFVMPLLFFMLEPSGEFLFPMSCLFITLSSVKTLTFMDERNKSEIIINSLPLSRKDIIIARYITCAVFIISAMVSTIIIVFLLRGIAVIGDIGVYHPNFYIEIPWYVVVSGVIYSLVFVATFFPSYYGTKSKVVRSIVSAVAMGIGVLLWMFISDDLNKATPPFINWIMNPLHLSIFIVGFITLVSIYIASMFLTIKIYEARDL